MKRFPTWISSKENNWATNLRMHYIEKLLAQSFRWHNLMILLKTTSTFQKTNLSWKQQIISINSAHYNRSSNNTQTKTCPKDLFPLSSFGSKFEWEKKCSGTDHKTAFVERVNDFSPTALNEPWGLPRRSVFKPSIDYHDQITTIPLTFIDQLQWGLSGSSLILARYDLSVKRQNPGDLQKPGETRWECFNFDITTGRGKGSRRRRNRTDIKVILSLIALFLILKARKRSWLQGNIWPFSTLDCLARREKGGQKGQETCWAVRPRARRWNLGVMIKRKRGNGDGTHATLHLR